MMIWIYEYEMLFKVEVCRTKTLRKCEIRFYNALLTEVIISSVVWIFRQQCRNLHALFRTKLQFIQFNEYFVNNALTCAHYFEQNYFVNIAWICCYKFPCSYPELLGSRPLPISYNFQQLVFRKNKATETGSMKMFENGSRFTVHKNLQGWKIHPSKYRNCSELPPRNVYQRLQTEIFVYTSYLELQNSKTLTDYEF